MANTKNSVGVVKSGADWLDKRFKTRQVEYEAALRWVDLQPGWHVLDAGCGTGGFLRRIAAAVGAAGRVDAIDIAPEHVERINALAETDALACPAAARLGSILNIPFDDNTFDAVWCSNVLQYLTDAELDRALAELTRVVKPGGMLAVKDADALGFLTQPAPLELWPALIPFARQHNIVQFKGCYRTCQIGSNLLAAGLSNLQQAHFAAVRTFPLDADEQELQTTTFRDVAEVLHALQGPDEMQADWRRLADVTSPDHIFKNPSVLLRETFIVFKGQVIKSRS